MSGEKVFYEDARVRVTREAVWVDGDRFLLSDVRTGRVIHVPRRRGLLALFTRVGYLVQLLGPFGEWDMIQVRDPEHAERILKGVKAAIHVRISGK